MLLTKDKHAFLKRCIEVIEVFGEENNVIILGRELNGKTYEDDLISIELSENNYFMEVMRKIDGDPIIYVQDGETILFENDFIYLVEHVENLLKKTPH